MKIDARDHYRTGFACDFAFLTSFNADEIALDVRLRSLVSADMPLVLMDPTEFDRVAPRLKAAGEKYRVERALRAGHRFHPKVAVLVGEDRWHLVVGSANLTMSGLGQNAELVGSVSAMITEQSNSLLTGLREFLRLTCDRAVPARARPYLESILRVLPRGAPGDADGPAFISSYESPIGDQLLKRLEGRAVQELSIMSPYWDDQLEAACYLAERAKPDSLRLYLDPTSATLPANRTRLRNLGIPFQVSIISLATDNGAARRLHAKAVWATCEDGDLLLYGSANCSRAGMLLSAATGGNVEVGVLLELEAGRAVELLLSRMDGLSVEDVDLDQVGDTATNDDDVAPPSCSALLSVVDAEVTDDGILVSWDAPDDWQILVVLERAGEIRQTDGGRGRGTVTVRVPAGKGSILAHVQCVERQERSHVVIVHAPQGVPVGPLGITEVDFHRACELGGAQGFGTLLELAYRRGEASEFWLIDLLATFDVGRLFSPSKKSNAVPTAGAGPSSPPAFAYDYDLRAAETLASSVDGIDADGPEGELLANYIKRESDRAEASAKQADRQSLESASMRLLVILLCNCLTALVHAREAAAGNKKLHHMKATARLVYRVNLLLGRMKKLATRHLWSPTTGTEDPSYLCIEAAAAAMAIASTSSRHFHMPAGEPRYELSWQRIELEEVTVGPYGNFVDFYDAAARKIYNPVSGT